MGRGRNTTSAAAVADHTDAGFAAVLGTRRGRGYYPPFAFSDSDLAAISTNPRDLSGEVYTSLDACVQVLEEARRDRHMSTEELDELVDSMVDPIWKAYREFDDDGTAEAISPTYQPELDERMVAARRALQRELTARTGPLPVSSGTDLGRRIREYVAAGRADLQAQSVGSGQRLYFDEATSPGDLLARFEAEHGPLGKKPLDDEEVRGLLMVVAGAAEGRPIPVLGSAPAGYVLEGLRRKKQQGSFWVPDPREDTRQPDGATCTQHLTALRHRWGTMFERIAAARRIP